MQYAICSAALCPLRAEPSHKAEMVSQLLFGESCLILDKSADHWIKIRCKYDGYGGWCQDSHILEVDQSFYEQEKGLTRKWITEIDFAGSLLNVPLGSSLPFTKKARLDGSGIRIHYEGKTWNPLREKTTKAAIKKLAYSFLGTPYLWGGKTVFGTDCSGYTQTVFRFFNINLSRDAWQQALQGTEVRKLEDSKFGDLAFFDNDAGKITHVGILLNKHKIIHASGKVREDKINSEGIINVDTQQQTHKLKIIKRFL